MYLAILFLIKLILLQVSEKSAYNNPTALYSYPCLQSLAMFVGQGKRNLSSTLAWEFVCFLIPTKQLCQIILFSYYFL